MSSSPENHTQPRPPARLARTRLTTGRKLPAVTAAAACCGLLLIAACGSSGKSGGSSGSNYPDKPITLIVPAAAGGAADREARAFAEGLGQQLHVAVTTSDIPGANGVIGTDALLSKPADGYTILWSITSQITYNLASGTEKGSLSDFTPVAQLGGEPVAVVVKNGQFKSLADLINYAKQNPGKVTIGGTDSTGGVATFADALIKDEGLKARYVPYSGSPDIISALLGGEITAGVVGISNVESQAKAGQISYLAIDAKQKDTALPNVPTLASAGVNTGTADLSFYWRGILVKAGTNSTIVTRLAQAITKVMSSSSTWKQYVDQNMQEQDYLNSKDFMAALQTALGEWKAFGVS